MTNINGVQPPAAPQPIEGISQAGSVNRPLETGNISDVVEISSSAASLVAKVKDIPEVRTELVQRVKAEIAAGTYETPERIELAVDRLMDELIG
jgi:negative regulator of flagellin synthesis FlgM